MPSSRPHFYTTIAELEKLVQEDRHDRTTLVAVNAELAHRDTDRSDRLLTRVTALLAGVELPLEAEIAPSQSLSSVGPTTSAGPLGIQVPEANPIKAPRSRTRIAAIRERLSATDDDGADRRDAPKDDAKAVVKPPTPPIVASRMLDLIDYLVAVEKDKVKIVTDVGDHHGFHQTHDQLAGLPGITFNRIDGDDAAWLHIERLARRPPPEPTDPALIPRIVLADDPARPPQVRDTLSAAECSRAGIAIGAEGGVALDEQVPADAVRSALDHYIEGAWSEWSRAERERRKTIAVYGTLFALRQTLAAPDGMPQELVCGIGYAGVERHAKRLCYPLLTVALDIELNPISHVIALVPRGEARPVVEADPLDILQLSQVDAWRRDATRALGALEDDPLSPFVSATFEPILRQAAALLDPDARYARGSDDAPLPPPVAGRDLIVTDVFGFLQRERRATQLMADLLAFRALIEAGGDAIEIPPAVAALFTAPSDNPAEEDFPTFRGICSVAGVTSSDGDGEDLFFPKPFNREQVQIAQRLAVRHGVVVQGPPGTGKTHTIANIISHYLATGKRVLVTSQKSPALRVLHDQLPPEIRPLAVSLLDSDREGLRQFRASVDTISERLQNLSRSVLEQQIAALDSRADTLHRRLVTIDNDVDRIGRSALQPVELEGQRVEPITAAREVLRAGEEANWLDDPIDSRRAHDPLVTDEDIGALRSARRAVGDALSYLPEDLPPEGFLADSDGILAMHADLVRAAEIARAIASGTVWALVSDGATVLHDVAEVESRLSGWIADRDRLAQSPPAWDHALDQLLAAPENPLLDALRDLEPEATALADDQAWFLTRPVDIADGSLSDPRFRNALANLATGGSGLGPFAGIFARSTKSSVASVRLRGKAPASAEDWASVHRYMDANDRAAGFMRSWNHAVEGTALPGLATVGLAAGREALQILDRITAISSLGAIASALTEKVRQLLPRWPSVIARHGDPGSALASLRSHLDRAKLQHAERLRRDLTAATGDGDTALHRDIRNLLGEIGERTASAPDLGERIDALNRRLHRLHALASDFDTISAISDKIEANGAPRWADRLCTEISGEVDHLCPGDWRRRWRLRRLRNWLDASDQAGRLRELHDERERIEADLAKTYTRSIELRTWLALKKQASPAVLAALAAYASAVGRIGRGTGRSANRHRNTARDAANRVKGALPCWIMPHHRVSESLPAELGIFDLVIVDEASQSTLASLPALFRARQILVVGDDQQVSPDNVGLSADHANALVARHLGRQVPIFVPNMRQEASLYDLASVIFGGDRLMLREHFRCAAPIIEFSKRQFYQNELRPLRLSKASERLDPVLVDVRITDGYRRGKTNPPEAAYIVAELGRMGSDPAFDGRTIGVTTLLGTEQAALIYRLIEAELGIPFIERFHIRVGDPALFQGDERDVMFLSMVAAPGHATALSGLQYDQRFNVAASRARERMILVRSVDLDQLSPRDMLRRALIEHFSAPFPADATDAVDARLRCESDFERDMFDALVARGFGVDTQVAVGRHRIDMVVEGDEDRRLAIECDGDRYHGPEEWPADIARQRTLERAGWKVWRCFASRFVREREAVLTELATYLAALDIQPKGSIERARNYTELRYWTSTPDPIEP